MCLTVDSSMQSVEEVAQAMARWSSYFKAERMVDIMFIQNTLEIINTFLDRYVPFVNEQGDYSKIETIKDKVKITHNDYYHSYSLFVWIEDGELKIENDRGESVFDYAEENDWTEEDVNYIKFGRR